MNELSDRANIADIVEGGRLSGLERQIDSHNNRLFTLEKSAVLIVEIHTALLGTIEKPGLVREMKANSEFIEGCKKRHEEERQAEKLKKHEEEKGRSSLRVKLVYGAIAAGVSFVVWLLGKAGII